MTNTTYAKYAVHRYTGAPKEGFHSRTKSEATTSTFPFNLFSKKPGRGGSSAKGNY